MKFLKNYIQSLPPDGFRPGIFCNNPLKPPKLLRTCLTERVVFPLYIRHLPDRLSDFFAWREFRDQRGIWQDEVSRRDTNIPH
jgi:hypothetical protein